MMDEISVAIYCFGTIQTVSINGQRCTSMTAAEEESKNCMVALTSDIRAAGSRNRDRPSSGVSQLPRRAPIRRTISH